MAELRWKLGSPARESERLMSADEAGHSYAIVRRWKPADTQENPDLLGPWRAVVWAIGADGMPYGKSIAVKHFDDKEEAKAWALAVARLNDSTKE